MAVLTQTACEFVKTAELKAIVFCEEILTAKVDKPLVPILLIAETDILPFIADGPAVTVIE